MAPSTLPGAMPLPQLHCSFFKQKNAPTENITSKRPKANERGMGNRERAQPLSWAGKRPESPRQDNDDLGRLVKAREDGRGRKRAVDGCK